MLKKAGLLLVAIVFFECNGGRYRPYGEEVTERTHSQYADDTIRKQFTSYERDNESEEDYAQARY